MSAHEFASVAWAAEPDSSEVVHRSNTTGHDSEGAPRKVSARRSLSRRFSAIRSTEDHHQADYEDEGFFGAYGHVRRKLDYTYHANYTKTRQWLHDSIIEDFLENREFADACHPGDPWLIFTVGAQGAGKRFTIDRLVKDERLSLLSFIFVDPGKIPISPRALVL
jgi:hypothetical protein